MYSGTDIPEGGEKKDVFILSKGCTVKNPSVPVTQTITKKGKESITYPGEIEWTVEVNAAENTTDVSLENYVFEDDLTEVGGYVSGSFQIDGASISDAAVYNVADKKLSHSFGDVTGKQAITFRTKIADSMLITGDSVNNIAKFGKSGDMSEGPVTVIVAKKTLISKEGAAGNEALGGKYDPENQTIKWIITVDPKGIGLTNVTVKDKLLAEWSLEFAMWDWVDSPQPGITLPVSPVTAEPPDGTYELGNGSTALTNRVKLVITSKMPKKDYVVGKETYYNKAVLNSSQVLGRQESNNAGIGIDGIIKEAEAIDYVNRQIPWTVTADLKEQTGFLNPEDIKVYDLLACGNKFNVGDSNLSTLLPAGIDLTKVYPQHGQKIVDSSFNGAGLTGVGDLLVVKGFTADSPYSFTLETQVLDSKVFAKDSSVEVENYAFLFYDDEYLNQASDKINYVSDVLSKDVMNADGSGVGTTQNGFNYEDKTAVFKLNVNPDGYDLTGADIPDENGGTKALGKETVKDTLLEGLSLRMNQDSTLADGS